MSQQERNVNIKFHLLSLNFSQAQEEAGKWQGKRSSGSERAGVTSPTIAPWFRLVLEEESFGLERRWKF